MKLSAKGRAVIEDREGRILKVYKDSKGLLTVGVGHLVTARDNMRLGQRITAELADQLFAVDAVRMEKAVEQGVKVPLKQYQFDALVSLAYNIGAMGLLKSTLVKRINAGASEAQIKAAFLAWNKPPEIRSRRQAEWQQFAGGPVVGRV